MGHELQGVGSVPPLLRNSLPDEEAVAQARIDLAATFRMAARLGLHEGICNHFSAMVPGRDVAGQPLRLPTLDIETISAGGGSIARVDVGGALRVGPASTGAVPGPACYGQGGAEATVTDAAVLLGILDPQAFLGDPAWHRERIAGALGLGV